MMTHFHRITSALALTCLAVPAVAQQRSAAFETSADRSASQPFMFSGATIRMSLDGRGDKRPQLAMRLAGGTTSAGFAPRIGEGIAFSAVPGSKPQLTLAGQDSKQLQKRLNMSDGAKAGLIIGGIAVTALVVVAATTDWWGGKDDGENDWF